MKLKNMKMSKAEAKAEVMPAMDAPEYPYGLCLRLDKEQLVKLGIKSFPGIGESVEIEAKATVKGVNISSGQGGDYASVELQITDLALDTDDADKTAKTAKMLFGGMESKKGGPNS